MLPDSSLPDTYEDILQVQFPTINACEYVHSLSSTPVSSVKVKRRLRAHIQFWKHQIDIGASNFIIDTIQDGYKIPFRDTPTSTVFSNNSSSLDDWQFVFDSITELLSTDQIVQVQVHELIVVSPLSAATQPGGKKRLILDLRYVNSHVYKQTTKFEDCHTALHFFNVGSFFTKFDLKSGYHHLDVFSEHQPYLGFSWKLEGETPSYFMFTVLPFCLTSAPYIFTKLLRPIVKHWRSQGISIVVYLDDGFDVEKNLETCTTNSGIIRSDLLKTGFIVHMVTHSVPYLVGPRLEQTNRHH